MFVKNFVERPHDKLSFVHTGVRQGECLALDVYIVIQEQVDVDGAVMVAAVMGFCRATQVALYLLVGSQSPHGRERRKHQTGSVQKAVGTLEAPRLCFDK